MFYMSQNISCKEIGTFQLISFIEILILEINLGKWNLLIFGTYKPPKHKQWFFPVALKWFCSTLYKNCVLLGDLKIVRGNTQLQNLCECFLFERLIKKSTCYNGDTRRGVDHIITKIPKRFMKPMVLETGISYHHEMIMIIFHSAFTKDKLKPFDDHCFKKFNLE